MDEALNIILRLWTETDPITYEADWFTLKEATVHLRPYTLPHIPVAVAASYSPAGMVCAGKYGLSVLSLNTISVPGAAAPDLAKFWDIAEETADKYGKTVSRDDWGIVIHVHLAESRKEAIEQAREASGRYQKEYFEDTLGPLPGLRRAPGPGSSTTWSPPTTGVSAPPTTSSTPSYRLEEESGGFGRLLIQATEWGTREQVLHSYELLARYVMPRFQGSVTSLHESREWSVKETRRAGRHEHQGHGQGQGRLRQERSLGPLAPTLTTKISENIHQHA